MSYPADPYWSYVKSLLHFDGVHGSTKIVEERHANATAGNCFLSNLKRKFGGTALRCSGGVSGVGYIQGSVAMSTAYDMCLEFWMYPEETENANPVAVSLDNTSAYRGFGVVVDSAAAPGKLAVYYAGYSTANFFFTSASDVVYNQWCHVAVTRTGSTFRLFINGVLDAQATNTSAVTATLGMQCGAGYNGTAGTQFLGYLSDVRFTYGVARYAEDFTPPTAAFPHSGVVDNYYDKVVLHLPFDGENGGVGYQDRKNHPVASGGVAPPPAISTTQPVTPQFGRSVLFIGTSAYWLKSTSADYLPGANDFCIEGRHAATASTGNTGTLFALMAPDGVTLALGLNYSYSGNAIRLIVGGVTIFTVNAGGAMGGNASGHWAVVRSGSNIKVYLNGAQYGTTHVIGSASVDSNGELYLFGHPSGYTTYGTHEEIRYTIGNARYTTVFTAPSEPFPQVGIQRLSGAVLDASSNPISRKVRAFRRSDGLLTDTVMSDPTTGAFELRATDTSEHFVVVFDDSRNALVYDHVVPVV